MIQPRSYDRPATRFAPRPNTEGNPAYAPQRVRLFGHEVGSEPPVPELDVKFKTFAGNHGGQAFQIEIPEGWRATKIGSGVAIYDPDDPTTAATFQWHMKNGRQTAGGLVEQLLSQTEGTDARVLSQRPEGPRNTPMGLMYMLNTDLAYTLQGTRVRGEVNAAVCNAPNAYIPFWSGTLNAIQASEAKWRSTAPILHRIASSFKAG